MRERKFGCMAWVGLPFAVLAGWVLYLAIIAIGEEQYERGVGMALGAFIVGLVGGAFLLAGTLSRRVDSEEKQWQRRRETYPDEPWLWEVEWAAGAVEFQVEWLASAIMWGFAIFWNVMIVVSLVLVGINYGLAEEPYLTVFLAVFMAAGVFLASLAWRVSTTRRKYGRSLLELGAVPAPLGGELTATLYPPERLEAADDLIVTLDCVDERGESSKVVWRDQRRVPLKDPSAGVGIAFDIPYDCPATQYDADGDEVYSWKVSVSGATKGVDYNAFFEVPVFETPDSDPTRVRAAAAELEEIVEQPRSSRITVTSTTGAETVFTFPFPGWLPWWMVIAVLPVGLIWPVSRTEALEDVPFVFVALGGIAITLFLLGINAMGVLFTPTRVRVTGDEVAVRRGLGPVSWTRHIPRASISEVRYSSTTSGPRVQYDVEVANRAGTTYTVALAVRDLGETKWLTAELKRLLGL